MLRLFGRSLAKPKPHSTAQSRLPDDVVHLPRPAPANAVTDAPRALTARLETAQPRPISRPVALAGAQSETALPEADDEALFEADDNVPLWVIRDALPQRFAGPPPAADMFVFHDTSAKQG